ncbi:hypothetical protein EJ04DRAFT_516661 [Polyplosphaeria fusca]|uniref:Uncharacterized protein n=1 Tax=Polyplosphaeria fusca TaxID=682080 RepID=A0A9P4UX04_9PLEO|nr:hypothetical protein EJ04DRAFT_516661 [Polyplosphaeria fusca]
MTPEGMLIMTVSRSDRQPSTSLRAALPLTPAPHKGLAASCSSMEDKTRSIPKGWYREYTAN